MMEAKITVYGAPWCPDCARSKQFLGERRVLYNWVYIGQDEAGRQYVQDANDGKQIIPTIVFLRMIRFWLNQAMLSWLRSWESTHRLPNLSTI